MYGERKTIARGPCTPLSIVEKFGEKIGAEACSGKWKIMMMSRRVVKSRVSGFSLGKREAGRNIDIIIIIYSRNELGFYTARDESMSCCCVFSRHG